MYRACLMGSVVKGWKPRRAACAICGSVRGMVIVAGAGAGNGVLDVGGAECDGVPPEAIFCSLSRSFWTCIRILTVARMGAVFRPIYCPASEGKIEFIS